MTQVYLMPRTYNNNIILIVQFHSTRLHLSFSFCYTDNTSKANFPINIWIVSSYLLIVDFSHDRRQPRPPYILLLWRTTNDNSVNGIAMVEDEQQAYNIKTLSRRNKVRRTAIVLWYTEVDMP